MRNVASQVNESVRREEARLQVVAVQKSFYPAQNFGHVPNRFFLREGDLTKLSGTHEAQTKRYHFFLFSESIAYGGRVMQGLYTFHKLVKVRVELSQFASDHKD